MGLLVRGKMLSEVAVAIGVSYKTTAQACAALRDKPGARTRLEMISIALDRRQI